MGKSERPAFGCVVIRALLLPEIHRLPRVIRRFPLPPDWKLQLPMCLQQCEHHTRACSTAAPASAHTAPTAPCCGCCCLHLQPAGTARQFLAPARTKTHFRTTQLLCVKATARERSVVHISTPEFVWFDQRAGISVRPASG